MCTHTAVANVAVIAKPDEKWGETPCAFIELNPGFTPDVEPDLMSWYAERERERERERVRE
jgi:fatty-acyl-CoA synthase